MNDKIESEEPPEHFCMCCGGDERKCDCKDFPNGMCDKCGFALKTVRDGEDADGNRGRTLVGCSNEKCEDYLDW